MVSYLPIQSNNNDEITIVRDNPDIQDHPDKYVQAEILFESDKKALLSKSKGDYHLLVKNDPSEALKFYLPALADTSDGNGILKRELLEVIPICLSKIGDNNQGMTSILTAHWYISGRRAMYHRGTSVDNI